MQRSQFTCVTSYCYSGMDARNRMSNYQVHLAKLYSYIIHVDRISRCVLITVY